MATAPNKFPSKYVAAAVAKAQTGAKLTGNETRRLDRLGLLPPLRNNYMPAGRDSAARFGQIQQGRDRLEPARTETDLSGVMALIAAVQGIAEAAQTAADAAATAAATAQNTADNAATAAAAAQGAAETANTAAGAAATAAAAAQSSADTANTYIAGINEVEVGTCDPGGTINVLTR
jgi:methyl-accepting chemotaxis protein